MENPDMPPAIVKFVVIKPNEEFEEPEGWRLVEVHATENIIYGMLAKIHDVKPKVIDTTPVKLK